MKNALFRKLNNSEKIDLCENIIRARCEIQVWQKGESNPEKFLPDDCTDDFGALYVVPKLRNTQLQNKKVLFALEIGHRQFFSSSILETRQDRYLLGLSNDIFKCEKRKNFRLPASTENQLEFAVNGQNFKVIDVSAGGISIEISQNELELFPKQQTIEQAEVQINEHSFVIPFCKVVYQKNYNIHEHTKMIGIEFVGLDQQMDTDLFKAINTAVFRTMNQ